MIRLFSCIVLGVLVNGDTAPAAIRPTLSPYGHLPGVVPPVNPINPASPLYPYAPGRNPLVPGYNNPYYNGGAAVPILTYSNVRGIDNSYSYSFSTADGKQAQESGFLKDAYIDNNGEPQGTQVVEGSFAYISPEGTPIQVNYIADENGFRPSGVHIPADGEGVVPLAPIAPIAPIGPIAPISPIAPIASIAPLGLKDPKGIYDPIYNRYNPHGYHNPYYGQYNNPLVNPRPYDPRYPYDPKYSLYNPYRPWGSNKEAKEVPKKETA